MNESIFSMAFTLFLLMDPIGNIPIYLTILQEVDPAKRTRLIIRESLIALLIIFVFIFLGNPLLDALSIQSPTLFVAGGIILFLMAIHMIFPGGSTLAERFNPDGSEPLIFPLAIPLVAGPTILAMVMIYSSQEIKLLTICIATILAWFVSTFILLMSTLIQKILSDKGVKALERLMGLILILLSVQMIFNGVGTYFTSK
jgi:multiple antibiotic resistance protein